MSCLFYKETDMAHYAQIRIQRMSNDHKLYVYRSTNPDDINTIEKIRHLEPIFMVDESVAQGDEYVLKDTNLSQPITGCTYYGPEPNLVPCVEYESDVEVIPVNNYTYMNCLVLKPLPLKYNGTMLYYSVIGVNDALNTITHLSNVQCILVDSEFQEEGTRHIYSCDDFTGKDDTWKYVGASPWEEGDIRIGDYSDKFLFDKYDCPVVEAVTPLEEDKITAQTRMTLTRNFLVMEIQNPWQRNNRQFNYRRLKSFKVCNVVDNQYSRYSEPTYQSWMPVPIEKLLILRKTDPEEEGIAIDLAEMDNEDVEKWEIIRRDGIYYDRTIHKQLGLNKWNIPLGETISVFNEASTQDTINIQMPANVAHVYDYTFYLFDTYGNHSEPVVKTVVI